MLNFKGLAFLLVLAATFSQGSFAAVVQILHTNDLHASLETFGAPTDLVEYGGWAELKALFDKLTADAKARGIETIKLDAGDYTEGTSFYFAQHGSDVLRAFQHLGYDATTIGNHDWMMGADDMNSLYGSNPFPFPVLSANIKFNSRLENLKKQILPSTQIIRGGIKFGIFGLSTDESLYSWIPRVNSPKKDMRIQNYREEVYADDGESGTRVVPGIANDLIKQLRKDNDVVIALTHIGYQEDKLLAAHSEGLDLVVGGHSHTFLHTPTWIPNRAGKAIPVVQTGFNGTYIGRILLNVEPGKPAELISYDLIPVYKTGVKDPTIESDIQTAENDRDEEFGTRLSEVIGVSEDRLISGEAGPTSFSKFVVQSMRSVSDADFIFDVGAFHGNTPQPQGPVTRLNLMEMYPRKFEQDQNEGLYVYEASIPGIFIEGALKYAVRFGFYVEFDGLTYDLEKMTDENFEKAKKKYSGSSRAGLMTQYYPDHIRIRGQPVNSFKWYRFAAPESLIRGALSSSPLMKLLIRKVHPTSHTIWDAMNFYLLKVGKIEKRINPDVPSPWSPGVHAPESIVESFVGETIFDLRFPEIVGGSSISFPHFQK